MTSRKWKFSKRRIKKTDINNPSEHSIQKGFFDYLSKVYPHYRKVCFSVPNEGGRSLIHGSLLKQRGLTRGIPDVFCAIPSGAFHGLFIEFKKSTGLPTQEQLQVISELRKYSYRCEICYSLDEAIQLFIDYTR